MKFTLPILRVREAAAWSDSIMATGLERSPNYTGFAAPGRFLTGYLGEQIVAEWLDLFGVLYRHRVDLRGRSSAPEFAVELDGARAYLEVKTASPGKARRLYVPQAQRLDADVYVAAYLTNREPVQGVVAGWLTRDEVAALPLHHFAQGCPARTAEYGALRPMHDLAAKLGRRCVVKTL